MIELLKKLVDRRDLNEAEAEEAARYIMDGKASEAEMAAFLTALRLKGETAEEIASIASVMRDRSRSVSAPHDTVDMCGTGGARIKTFNVSTVSSIVVASAGVPVAKHGNRSFTSRSGSADVLEKLGVNIQIEPGLAGQMLLSEKITFLFAPSYHPATRNVAPVRKALGFRTVFNLLGPLTNPARVRRQLIGVFSEEYIERVAEALLMLGTDRALVVYGRAGMDEISPAGLTEVCEVRNGGIERYQLDSSEFREYGTEKWSPQPVSDAEDSASHALSVLNNTATPGERSIVLINAGACLYVSGRVPSIVKGVEMALDEIESGRAAEKLSGFIHASRGGG
ncbi:MAG: anthranilate phosphoribosyltransferase [Candidatus Thermoplasmatota archaeon]|nr:anthranilate phosphoribosyltransferase [Candidatus Thermoplasmatota archaeon]